MPESKDAPEAEPTPLCVCPCLKAHHLAHVLSQLLLQLQPQGFLPLQGQSHPSLSAVQRAGQTGTGHLDRVEPPRQLVAHVRQVPAVEEQKVTVAAMWKSAAGHFTQS